MSCRKICHYGYDFGAEYANILNTSNIIEIEKSLHKQQAGYIIKHLFPFDTKINKICKIV